MGWILSFEDVWKKDSERGMITDGIKKANYEYPRRGRASRV